MKIRFKLKMITKKVLILNIQKKFLKQMVKDFETQGWEVETQKIKGEK